MQLELKDFYSNLESKYNSRKNFHEWLTKEQYIEEFQKNEDFLSKFGILDCVELHHSFNTRIFRYNKLNPTGIFCYKNKYGCYCMHEFLISDFKNGIIDQYKYNNIKAQVKRRINRLISIIDLSFKESYTVTFYHLGYNLFGIDNFEWFVKLYDYLKLKCNTNFILLNASNRHIKMDKYFKNIYIKYDMFAGDTGPNYKMQAQNILRQEHFSLRKEMSRKKAKKEQDGQHRKNWNFLVYKK